MSEIIYADPDLEVSAMCHKNHVDRAHLYEQVVPNADWEPVQEKAKSGPVIHIVGGSEQENSTPSAPSRNDKSELKVPTIRQVKRVLGALARWGVGAMFICGVADGLIDTTYGLMLTIVCIGWGLLHLLKVVAHG